jgi:hypothetical protein
VVGEDAGLTQFESVSVYLESVVRLAMSASLKISYCCMELL